MKATAHRAVRYAIPRQRGVITRQRLFELLDAARSVPAVWVSGAPGAGKTTLAASYVRGRQLACLWLRVDGADDDLAQFFSSLSAAAGDHAQRRRLPVFAAEHAARAQLFAQRYFRQLYERLAAGSCLVLDNLHELDEDGAALQAVRTAVEEAPSEVQLLLLSRSAPPAAMAALEAARKLERIDEAALRFTPLELQALLPRHDESARAVIYQLTQGWPAGVVLASKHWSAGRSGGSPSAAHADSQEAIFRFFAHEVLRALPAREQRFLQQVALLPEMSVAQAQALTHEPEAGRILEALYRRNLFTSYRRGAPDSYQFHALFRAYLLTQAAQHQSAAERSALREQAAQLLLQAGEVPAALELLVQAQQWDEARSALLQAAPGLLRQGRYATVRRWVEALPAPLVEHDGWLLYWAGQAHMREDEMAACEWYERAYRRFEQTHDRLGSLLAAAAAIVAIREADATFKDAKSWSARLRAQLAQAPESIAPADDLLVCSATAAAATMEAPVGSESDTLASIERLLDRIEASGPSLDDNAVVLAGTSALLYCIQERNHALQERVVRLVEPRLRSAQVSSLTRGRWLVRLDVCRFVFGSSSPASPPPDFAGIREARAIAEREHLPALLSYAVGGEIAFAYANRDEARWARLLGELETVLDWKKSGSVCNYFICLCRLHVMRGAVQEALRAAHGARQAAHESAATDLQRHTVGVISGYALIAAQRIDDAIEGMQSLLGELSGRSRTVAQAFVALAHGWKMQQSHAGEYVALLCEGMRKAAESGWTTLFEPLPAIAGQLCADALEHGIEPEFVRACIAWQRLPAPATAGESWPWPVRVRLLGAFELRVNEAPVRFGSKTPRRQIELLQAIAVSGANGLDARQALDWLWPAGEAGKNSFEVALHRLRKSLAESGAIVLNEGRLSFDRARVWTDVAQFEALSEQLLNADLAGPSSAQLQAQARRLLGLYRGPLLPEAAPSAWVRSAQARLHDRFERVVQALGAQLEARGEPAAALELYTHALEHDNLAEELYRGQIRCHIALGQPANALRAYRRCRELLSVVLGIAPALQTTALIDSVREHSVTS